MPNIDKIIKELKNRKVFRSLTIYAGFSFILLQVCDIIIPRLFLPEWIMTFVIILVIIGFPTIAVLSWIYDITPTESGETISSEHIQSLGIYTLTGLVLTVIGITFWISVGVFGISFGGNEEVPSIGILMMDNIGGTDDEFWVRGITEDLIVKIAGAGRIRVVPMKEILKVDINQNIKIIAEKLQVKYILTSSLLKKEDEFDLRCQLIEAESGISKYGNKWSEPIDKAQTIVGSIAENIIKSLKVSTKQDISKIPTTNAEAYEYYLKAKYKYQIRKNKEDIEVVRGLLQMAIALDDNIITAKNLLAQSYTDMANYDMAMKIHKKNIKQAEENDNKMSMAKSLNGIGIVKYYQGENDIALDYFNKAYLVREQIGDNKGMGSTLNNIGMIYKRKGEYDKALDYYISALEILEKLGEKLGMAHTLGNLGNMYKNIGDYNNAIDYYNRTLEIFKEINNESGLGKTLNNIGNLYKSKDDYDNALDYYISALEILEKLNDKSSIRICLSNIGKIYKIRGDNDKSLNYYTQVLVLREELGDNKGLGISLVNIGIIYSNKGDYYNAAESIEKSLAIQNEIELNDGDLLLRTTIFLYLTYKNLGREYDVKEIQRIIKETEHIEFELNYRLYQLLTDTSYLETAYNQVQEKAGNLEPDIKAKFIRYPIPSAILEEWEKVK